MRRTMSTSETTISPSCNISSTASATWFNLSSVLDDSDHYRQITAGMQEILFVRVPFCAVSQNASINGGSGNIHRPEPFNHGVV